MGYIIVILAGLFVLAVCTACYFASTLVVRQRNIKEYERIIAGMLEEIKVYKAAQIEMIALAETKALVETRALAAFSETKEPIKESLPNGKVGRPGKNRKGARREKQGTSCSME